MPDLPKEVIGISLPDTRLATEAVRLAHVSAPPYLFNHSLRTFILASHAALAANWDCDEEILYVACVFHDIGLVKEFFNPLNSFEDVGGDVASVYLKANKVAADRTEIASLAIRLHTTPGTSDHPNRTIGLLQVGAGMDAFGFGCNLDPTEKTRLLAAFPRLGFKLNFRSALATYAMANPYHAGWTKDFLCTESCGEMVSALENNCWPE